MNERENLSGVLTVAKNKVMKAKYILAVFCGVILSGVFVSAQNVQSVFGTYEVSEVCTLAEDPTYKENADYTISLEVWQDSGVRFEIPAHGIPDFVTARFQSGENLLFPQMDFSQTYILDSSKEDTVFLYLNGSGYVKQDSLLMNYTLAETGVFGVLQCSVKGVRQNAGTEEKEIVAEQNDYTVFYDAKNQAIVVDVRLENIEWTLSMVDMRACPVLKKSGRGKSQIDISQFPRGLFVYQLFAKDRAIGSGKIVKL